MKLAIGCDHAGYDLKETLVAYLKTKGHEVTDKGCYSAERVDYPDFGHAAANAVLSNEVTLGILMCGSGNGINMSANKHKGIRAALCWKPEIAKLAKQHNDANILVLPARYLTEAEAKEIVDAYLSNEFEGGRHADRIKKIDC